MKSKHIRTVTLAALGLCAAGATLPAYSATTASVSVSSMYLWRGVSLSGAGPAVSGDLYFNHDSGAYAGIWTSSEGIHNSQETDLNVGFSKKFGEFGVDVGIYEYLYTGAGNKKDGPLDTDFREWYIGGSFGPVIAKLLINPEDSDSKYLTVDAMFGQFAAHVGMTKAADSENEYNDFNVSYMPVPNLMWTVSFANGKNMMIKEAPQLVVSYKWPFDIK